MASIVVSVTTVSVLVFMMIVSTLVSVTVVLRPDIMLLEATDPTDFRPTEKKNAHQQVFFIN